jgi:hypothetical protein
MEEAWAKVNCDREWWTHETPGDVLMIAGIGAFITPRLNVNLPEGLSLPTLPTDMLGGILLLAGVFWNVFHDVNRWSQYAPLLDERLQDTCAIKEQCTTGKERRITRWEHEHVPETLQQRLDQDPQAMRRQHAEGSPLPRREQWARQARMFAESLTPSPGIRERYRHISDMNETASWGNPRSD